MKDRKTKKVLNEILVLFVIFSAANSTFLLNDIVYSIFFIFLLFTVFRKRIKINKILLSILAYFIIISFISYFVNKTTFVFYTNIGFIIKIITAFLVVKVVGINFLKILEKWIYRLTLISLPIGIIQLFFQNIFYSLAPYLQMFTLSEKVTFGSWYVFFYMFNGTWPDRNSGFMWEPGAFALMLLLGLTLSIVYEGNKITKRKIIYLVAIITTFSTTGFIGASLSILYFGLKRKSIIIQMLFIPLFFIGLIEASRLDFMMPKVNQYLYELNHEDFQKETGYFKVNRFRYVLFAINESINFPCGYIGYGLVPSKTTIKEYHADLKGVSTAASVLHIWGWFGFFIYLFSLYKMFLKLDRGNKLLYFFGSLIIFVGFFSNPMEKSYLLFTLFFYPFINFKSIS